MERLENVEPISLNTENFKGTGGALLDLLPPQYRAAVMGQYVESTALSHSPNQFVSALEDRLLTTTVTSTFNALKEIINKQI